ncbi:MAG TPA: type IV toxin-antitoxin system AbiEi family antitoxin domain-containing protein [Nocardioides sp.]|nr:type IV toxin-antitoxin system AbiEi family antitoxin domain-containing protein [Nocardioides sp.]
MAGKHQRMMLPRRPADDPRNGPVILRRELIGQGLNDRAIARLVSGGDLVRVRRGAYASAEIWENLDQDGRFGLRGRAVLRQARAPALLSHTSGLPEFDAPTWGFELDDVHITRTDGLAGRKEAGVHQHCGAIRAGDLVVVNGLPVMNPARITLETTTLRNPEASLCVANYMLHRGLTTIEELNVQYVDMNWWPDTLSAEIVLRLADARIESVGETRTYWCCYQHGLPMPEPQFEIKDANGRVVARVDFAWPAFGVFLEFDGRIKYEKLLREGERASDVVLREKRREEMICRLTGWRCVRVAWHELASPERLAARIRAELVAA